MPGTETAIEGSTDDVGVFVRLHSGNKAMDAKAGKVFVEAEFEKFIKHTREIIFAVTELLREIIQIDVFMIIFFEEVEDVFHQAHVRVGKFFQIAGFEYQT